MRKKLVWTTAAMILLAAIGGYWGLSGFSMRGTITDDLIASGLPQDPGRSWRHKAGQLLLPLLYSHDTQYAAHYREEAFRAVQAGATEEEIRIALGEPLDKTRLEDGRVMWHYTKRGPKTQDFLVRIVEFGATRRVMRTHAEFYVGLGCALRPCCGNPRSCDRRTTLDVLSNAMPALYAWVVVRLALASRRDDSQWTRIKSRMLRGGDSRCLVCS